MASITMTASFAGGLSTAGRTSVSTRRLVVAAKASKVEGATKVEESSNSNGNNRRDLMFAAAAAAIYSAASGCGIAAAEPKRGTPEAKKAYAPVCVTMPTARICHK